jgi:hypothetical protein
LPGSRFVVLGGNAKAEPQRNEERDMPRSNAESSGSFDIAVEHAEWARRAGQSEPEILAGLGVMLFDYEFRPDWTRVIEELARAHLAILQASGRTF